jgi:DNA-binding transcriptional regulator YiaG
VAPYWLAQALVALPSLEALGRGRAVDTNVRAASSVSSAFRHAHEPILDAIDRDALPTSADLRREHGAVVSVIQTDPREQKGAIFRAQPLDCGPDSLGVAPRVVWPFELRPPCHEANRCSARPRQLPPIAETSSLYSNSCVNMVISSLMDGSELRVTLENLGISQADFARLIDVSPRTVALWLVGNPSTVPGPAAAYARFLNSLPPVFRQSEINRLKGTTMKVREGLYAIEFRGLASSGYGSLVLSNGNIFGGDIAGGRYDGFYAPDPATGMVSAQIKLFFPKGLQSVFGEMHPFDWTVDATTKLDPRFDHGVTRLQIPMNRWVDVGYRFMRELPPLDER